MSEPFGPELPQVRRVVTEIPGPYGGKWITPES